jgi:hypothetical protein
MITGCIVNQIEILPRTEQLIQEARNTSSVVGSNRCARFVPPFCYAEAAMDRHG